MARKIFELIYPDGSRKHIGRSERDDLLLSGCAKQTAPQKYLFTGQQYTLHSLSELSVIAASLIPTNLRHFLPGSFIFEHNGKRRSELLETPEYCIQRLELRRDEPWQNRRKIKMTIGVDLVCE